MIVYPAIDLIEGKCVRLYKGDFGQKTVYEASPVEAAQDYRDQGASWLHLVDLDGARDPARRQTDVIAGIIKQSGLQVQTGGGVRGEKDIEALLGAGAARVVIGSLAVKDAARTKEIFRRFGADKICLAADVTPKGEGYVIAVSGWQEEGGISLDDFLESYLECGLIHVLCTDISRDGTMTGCNFNLYRDIQESFPQLQLQASGGIGSLADLKKLDTAGVIIGKALYENVFTLKEALEEAA